MRVLYLNHTSRVSGAEHSLLTMLAHPPRDVEAWLASPSGELGDRAAAIGCRVTYVPEFDFSFRTSLFGLLAAASALRASQNALGAILRQHRFDVVHANSLRAGLIAGAPALSGRVPYVVHLRDALPRSTLGCLISWLGVRGAAAVVANSAYTLASARCIRHGDRCSVIYNVVEADRFDPTRYDRSAVRDQIGIPKDAPVLTVIGQVTPWKAQDDAIRILHALSPKYGDLHLLIVGEPRFTSRRTRHDNVAFMRELSSLGDALGVSQRLHFLGHRDDVPAILAATDVLLVPSTEEPFGRTVIEAMSMSVPVIATSVGGPAEILSDGETGLLRPPRRPAAWATAVASLLDDRQRRATITANARVIALQRFSVDRQAEDLDRLYRRVVA